MDCIITPTDPACVTVEPPKVDCIAEPNDPACVTTSPPPSSPVLPSTLTLGVRIDDSGEGKVISQEGKIDFYWAGYKPSS